ncbi:nitrogen assimilation transcription factor nirA [Chaetomidium leptoderma]|uniref:Nitrogen assimilation transcription factor nirA n=1 Tax=Chaetomidium leptoderma TaxID=669021 RepID=A0AAN6VN60_9PEZI|nr:nitrogen assimilation transcription factor nirA [Chaetomidium leptoderma]
MQNQGVAHVPITTSRRRILPAARPQTVHPRLLSNPNPPLHRRKSYSTAACQTCRKRKVKVRRCFKCNAARPTCSYCLSAAISCVYTTRSANETRSQALKRKLSEVEDRETTLQQIFEHLRDRPETESNEIVKRIKDGSDPACILRHIREGDLLLQLALVPETRYRFVFPYIEEMRASLVRPDNPYLGSWVYEWTKSSGSSVPQKLILAGQSNGNVEPQGPYSKPYHAAEVVDPLLGTVKPSEWTTVSSDDALMRKMLANYFLGNYEWLAPFQKDYFLEDMAAGRDGCCSSLLVNSVLAFASIAYSGLSRRYEYWNPRNLSYQFLAEAKRIWEVEITSGRTRITTIQASILIHLGHHFNAMDVLGAPYTQKAVDMAQRIGLFRSQGVIQQETRRSRARGFTAWALFNFHSLLAYAHLEPSLVNIAPAVPLPDPSTDPDWYGQIWLRYPLDAKLHTTHFPYLFRAQSELRVILADNWMQRYRVDQKEDWTPTTTLQAASDCLVSMRQWYGNLPEPLTAGRITFPSHLIMHMNYHNVIINLAHAVCVTGEAQAPENLEFYIQVRDASERHLETLVRLYYLRHGFKHFDCYLSHCLVQLGFMVLMRLSSPTRTNDLPQATTPSPPRNNPSTTNTEDKTTTTTEINTLRSTLFLAAKGIHEQGQSYFVGKALLRTLKAKMSPVEQQLLAQIIGDAEDRDPRVVAQMRHVRSRVLPSALSFADDPEVHQLGRLVEELGLGGDDGEEGIHVEYKKPSLSASVSL